MKKPLCFQSVSLRSTWYFRKNDPEYCRAFCIDENGSLENQLQVSAEPLGPGGVSLKLTAEQYRSGNESSLKFLHGMYKYSIRT